ncbi:MAG: FtsQ-type POTRA domain-containing protein [Erysipelotrichaceae bacterium]|nr:FtsQ-type POTRA domain-containing protein [Erysipelotrichaceae bacterium]
MAKRMKLRRNIDRSQPKAYRPLATWKKVTCGILVFACVCLGVYAFSPYTKVTALICTGNYYYTPQQIFKIAGLSVNKRTFSVPESDVEQKLAENPLIESADVSKEGQNITINVNEKMIIGYYEEDGANYLVASTGERIKVENETELRSLVHFPLMADLPKETIDALAKQVSDHPDKLTREIFEKIAEILPWQESYDKNMLKLVLQDGNTVFTSINSVFMISAYQQVLNNLQGENVCFLFDGVNGVINKVACSYMYLSPEERAENREIPKYVIDPDSYSKDDEDQQASEQGEQNAEQSTQQAPVADMNNPQPPEDLSTIADWQPSAVDGIQYSPSTGMFYSTIEGIYYTYDASTDTFYPY